MKKALVLLANGFETIEALTPVDVLRRCHVDVTIAGVGGKTLKSAQNVLVTADAIAEELEPGFDAVILPGGMPGATNLAASKVVKAHVDATLAKNGIVAAICASPAIGLTEFGLLNGRNATCYPGMENRFAATTTYKNEPVVEDGPILTSSGPGTSLHFAFALAKKLAGESVAQSVMASMLVHL